MVISLLDIKLVHKTLIINVIDLVLKFCLIIFTMHFGHNSAVGSRRSKTNHLWDQSVE